VLPFFVKANLWPFSPSCGSMLALVGGLLQRHSGTALGSQCNSLPGITPGTRVPLFLVLRSIEGPGCQGRQSLSLASFYPQADCALLFLTGRDNARAQLTGVLPWHRRNFSSGKVFWACGRSAGCASSRLQGDLTTCARSRRFSPFCTKRPRSGNWPGALSYVRPAPYTVNS
jgi:hypothetical protein